MPFSADEAAVDISADKYGVIWTPMRYFHLDDAGDRQIRLSCSYLTTDQATDGAARLARFIKDQAQNLTHPVSSGACTIGPAQAPDAAQRPGPMSFTRPAS